MFVKVILAQEAATAIRTGDLFDPKNSDGFIAAETTDGNPLLVTRFTLARLKKRIILIFQEPAISVHFFVFRRLMLKLAVPGKQIIQSVSEKKPGIVG